jgi:hypothetical protein
MSNDNLTGVTATFAPNSESNNGTPGRTGRDQESAVRELVAKALRLSKKRLTRHQLAEQLTKEAGFRVTTGMINDWASPSKKGLRFPASLIRPFFELTLCSDLAKAFMPYRLVFLCALGEWCFESHGILERIHRDFTDLINGPDRKKGKPDRNRKA